MVKQFDMLKLHHELQSPLTLVTVGLSKELMELFYGENIVYVLAWLHEEKEHLFFFFIIFLFITGS